LDLSSQLAQFDWVHRETVRQTNFYFMLFLSFFD